MKDIIPDKDTKIRKCIADYLMSPMLFSKSITEFDLWNDPGLIAWEFPVDDIPNAKKGWVVLDEENGVEVICLMNRWEDRYNVLLNRCNLSDVAHYYSDWDDDLILREDRTRIEADLVVDHVDDCFIVEEFVGIIA